jgi:hypothetical protein
MQQLTAFWQRSMHSYADSKRRNGPTSGTRLTPDRNGSSQPLNLRSATTSQATFTFSTAV